jgi:hypothetical protein
MTKITSTCASCGKLLRKADAYETVEKPIGRRMCKECFDKWLWGDVKDDKQ